MELVNKNKNKIMNQDKTKVIYKSSFPVFGLAFLIMLTLKLCKVTTISWWIVTMPLWLPFAIFLLCMLVVLGVMLVAAGISSFIK